MKSGVNPRVLSKSVLDSLLSKDKNKAAQKKKYVYEDYTEDEYSKKDILLDDDDDEGTIHPLGPNVDPKQLLNSLINANNDDDDDEFEDDDEFDEEDEDSDGIAHFSNHQQNTITRKPQTDGKNRLAAALPGQPTGLQAQIVKSRFITLSWSEPLMNADEVISYSVYYKMHTSDRWVYFRLI